MALKIPMKAPGGFETPEGYRKIVGPVIDQDEKTAVFAAVDYRDEAWRQAGGKPFARRPYIIGALAKKSEQVAIKDEAGQWSVKDTDAFPSFDEFMARTLGEFLADVGPGTTLADLLGAVRYGFARTLNENAGAEDA